MTLTSETKPSLSEKNSEFVAWVRMTYGETAGNTVEKIVCGLSTTWTDIPRTNEHYIRIEARRRKVEISA